MLAQRGVIKLLRINIFLTVLISSYSVNNILYASELAKQDIPLRSNETRHQWINERNGRVGALMISGELLSSPCSLETNEIDLQHVTPPQGMLDRYIFKLHLTGCGEEDEQINARHDKAITTHTVLLFKNRGNTHPDRWAPGNGKLVLRDGRNQFIFYMNKKQWRALSELHVSDDMQIVPLARSSLLHLILGYE